MSSLRCSVRSRKTPTSASAACTSSLRHSRGPTVPQRARTLGIPLLAAAIVAGVAFLLWPTKPPPPTPALAPAAPVTSGVTKESDASAETADLDLGVESVTLSVDSSPKGAIVAINGERRGRTPLAVELDGGRGGDGTLFATGIPSGAPPSRRRGRRDAP